MAPIGGLLLVKLWQEQELIIIFIIMVLVKLKNKAVSFFLTLLLLSCTANSDLVISGLDLGSSELIFDYQEDSAGDEEFFIRVFKLSKKELGLFSGRKKR